MVLSSQSFCTRNGAFCRGIAELIEQSSFHGFESSPLDRRHLCSPSSKPRLVWRMCHAPLLLSSVQFAYLWPCLMLIEPLTRSLMVAEHLRLELAVEKGADRTQHPFRFRHERFISNLEIVL